MAGSDPPLGLDSLSEAVAKMQRSARQTIPMFLVGILATLIAAGIAVFYILTLSADLREARAALEQSQAALMEARANLTAVNGALRKAQKAGTSPSNAGPIATAIADVSRSQSDIAAASISIKQATAKLSPAEVDDRFETVKTSDGFVSMRVQPTRASAEIKKVWGGSTVHCGEVRPDDPRFQWRWCKDEEGHEGFMSGRYLRKL